MSIVKRDYQVVYFILGNHSAARLTIILSRELRSHLLESYLPSTLFVIMSWGGFIIMPEVVPGRVVLLVTTLLSLVTMFDTVRLVFSDVKVVQVYKLRKNFSCLYRMNRKFCWC